MNGACYLTDGESRNETLLPLTQFGRRHCVCVSARVRGRGGGGGGGRVIAIG
jgi:hypothetical protein